MFDHNYFKTLAQYNQWMNEKLYRVCAELPESELRLDRGAFFGSVYHTLNHILYGDLAFMSRFTGDPAVAPELGAELYNDFAELSKARSKLDSRLIDWAASLDEGWLAEVQTYTSKVDGKTRSVPRSILVTHMFNHQTHHRGQITTLLSQMDLDVGITDMSFLPQFQITELPC